MRVALLGGGTIGRLILERARRGDLPGIEIVVLAGRSATSPAAALAGEFGVRYVTGGEQLLALRPDTVVEAASHAAVKQHLVAFLEAGINVVVLSAGALVDEALCRSAEDAARRSGALFYVPSGGIGGLDALKGAMMAGVDSVEIVSSKQPAAWKGIDYVEKLGIDLDGLTAPFVLYEGPARAGVIHFPQNVNIAAVLSMAGIGFDRTRLKAVAVPGLARNTHVISVRGASGDISIKLENVPAPDNPKTAWLACYSALAALKQARETVRFGT